MKRNGTMIVDIQSQNRAWMNWIAAGCRLEGMKVSAAGVLVETEPPEKQWGIVDVYLEVSRIKHTFEKKIYN
jgi:hypothetical protein